MGLRIEQVTIKVGQSLSTVPVRVGGARLAMIQVPAGFPTTAITFQASLDGLAMSSTATPVFQSVFNGATEVSVTVAASKAQTVVQDTGVQLSGADYLKIRSGTAAVPVAVTGADVVLLLGFLGE